MPSPTLLGQSILAGIFTGALYGLLGLGLSLSWGLLRQINLSHFALAFLGAYLTYQLAEGGGFDPLLTLVLIAPLFFAFGVASCWVIQRFRVSALNSLLATFGVAVIIENAIQLLWSADYRKLETPYDAVKFQVGTLFLPLPELMTLGAALALALATWAWLRHTDVGRATRAAAEDPAIAAAFGVDAPRLARLLSGLAAASAGVAGLCLALTYTLAPAQIFAWVGVVFATVMIGGLGNPLGPLLAGAAIGIAEALTMAVTAPAWAPLVSFSLLILFLLLRPARA